MAAPELHVAGVARARPERAHVGVGLPRFVNRLRPMLASKIDDHACASKRADDGEVWLHEETRVISAMGYSTPVSGHDLVTVILRTLMQCLDGLKRVYACGEMYTPGG